MFAVESEVLHMSIID